MTTLPLGCRRRNLLVAHFLLISSMLPAGTLWAEDIARETNRQIWAAPNDIETRNLFYGPGGQDDLPPTGPFQFVREDLKGTNPKLVVSDSKGTKWKIKLGAEAKPETVATRFLWAVGYFADEDYYSESVELSDVPSSGLRRLKGFIKDGTTLHGVRFEREIGDQKKEGEWKWKDNAYTGTRELNGLRVLMALLNNWDVKDENNALYARNAATAKLYAIGDLGATFGTTHYTPGHERSRGNLHNFEHSRFITRRSADRIDFATPGTPSLITIFTPVQFIHRVRLRWIGRNIPRADAKWIGVWLGKLSPQQIRDAFRSGGYAPKDIERFAQVMERRIAELNAL